jgi:[protein-PII] uridylyltransferase
MPTSDTHPNPEFFPDSLTEVRPAGGQHELREQLRRRSIPDITAEEIDIHFSSMPERYWSAVSESDLIWGLETIHDFFRLVAAPHIPPAMVSVKWRPIANSSAVKIMLCTWDRQGLLAKAAAALSAVRLDITCAEVFTRSDNVVLDVFSVVDFHSRGMPNPARLEETKFLIEGALGEPPRFASIWACTQHKYLAQSAHITPRIVFDNQSSPTGTIVNITASDRLGLLYDILQAIADSNYNVTQARVDTTGQIAHDILHITQPHGLKVSDSAGLAELRRKLEAAVILES